MNRILFIIFFVLFVISIKSKVWCSNSRVRETPWEADSIYDVCDKNPEFYGGKDSLIQFISSSIQYPEAAYQEGIIGKVYVKFAVDRVGKINNPSIVRKSFVREDSLGQRRAINSSDSVCLKLTNEALRIVQIMPQWKPGILKGDTVSAWVTLPFSFELQPKVPQKVEPYVIVDEMPNFPGGQSALLTYLCDNTNYPVEAQRRGDQGTSYISFIITVDGSISKVNILRSSGSILLDNEAVRVVSNMPKWAPGKQDGKIVPVHYTIPVRFSLELYMTKPRNN